MSLGKDLASIRKSKNLTLEDIQNAIKIPLNTLKSIENESIFSDPNRNKTYIRSFVRSYAKVLKIDDEVIVQALDEMEAGTYAGSLFPESRKESHRKASFPEMEEPATESEFEQEEEPPVPSPKIESSKKAESEAPDLNTINWADMGRKFSTASKSSRVWLFILVFVIAGAIGGTGYFFWDDIYGLFGSSNQEITEQTSQNQQTVPTPPIAADTTGAEDISVDQQNNDERESGDQQAQQPITLGDTLTVTVYAAFGQLEPVRVTSDLNWRTNPFWMEEGEAYYFDFQDTLLVRGQYSRLLLLFNGHVIENPRQNYFDPSFNSVVITRSVLNQDRYLAPPPREFPLSVGPPDTTIYRIRL